MTVARRIVLPVARQILSLRDETDHDATIRQVREDAQLLSGSRWALAFAIVIASVGLNVNSTAVIIGAMLISPLMGPIVGAGVALGTSDLALLRTSLRNLLVATIIALLASTAYFAITPLAEAQSELLDRTHPTLYDVVIALFGGAAGIVAVSRKTNKGQVAPGVAIATALMPPLCTAGFGLAHLNLWFFLGAMHLFLINALFICLATLGFVRLMAFARVSEPVKEVRRRIRTFITILTVALVLPSIYTGWNVVQETRFKGAARRFVAEQLTFADRTRLQLEMRYAFDSSTIDVTLIGEPLSQPALDSIRAKLPQYRLARTRLVVHQPLGAQPSAAQIADLVRQGATRSADPRRPNIGTGSDSRLAELEAETIRLRAAELPVATLTAELSTLFPTLRSLRLGRVRSVGDTSTSGRSVIDAATTWQRLPARAEEERVRAFIALRLGRDSIRYSSTQER